MNYNNLFLIWVYFVLGNVYLKELERLKVFIENGKKIRIWYSDAPYSLCGLYHICLLLKSYKNDIYVIKLPEYIIHENYMTVYRDWNEVSTEYFYDFQIWD